MYVIGNEDKFGSFFSHSVNCSDRVSVKIDHGLVNCPPIVTMLKSDISLEYDKLLKMPVINIRSIAILLTHMGHYLEYSVNIIYFSRR